MKAYGLQTHIWNNNLKSVLLLAGFPILLLFLLFGLSLVFVSATEIVTSVPEGIEMALDAVQRSWPFALVGALVWFVIAFALHDVMIRRSTGAKSLSRREVPEIYNLLENLCISRGYDDAEIEHHRNRCTQCFCEWNY